MRKNKLLLLLVLLMTAATGAWADETPLLTIESKDYTTFKSGNMTFDDKVTVTFSDEVENDGDRDGWYRSGAGSLLTVAGTNGYTITSCKFYTYAGTAKTGYTVAGESPSVYLSQGFVYTDDSKSVNLGSAGVTKIEVYTAAATGYTVSLKDGVKDAEKWTVKVGDGQAQALPIGGLKGDGTETVTLQYNGRLKVKGVKATSEAAPAVKPAATVTTAPTGAAVVGVGKETALVSGGVADGGTMMYAVTTENTKPASTDGFSDAVPTAQSITASGKVYVWYYVKGDDTHSDSEIAATAIEVPVADVVWDATNVFNSSHKFDKTDKWDPDPLTYEGITISVSGEEVSTFTAYDPMTQTGLLLCYGDEGDSFTFTAPQGKMFCKIEIIVNESIFFEDYGDWTSDETGKKFVWSGTAANAVTLGTVYTCATNLNSIGFYLSK